MENRDEDWSELMGFSNGAVKKAVIGGAVGLVFAGVAALIGIPIHNANRLSSVEANQEWTHRALEEVKASHREIRQDLKDLEAGQKQILQEIRSRR